MLLLALLAACDPAAVGEESDTTAPMEWHSRLPACEDDGLLRVDLGARWQFVQVFLYDDANDRWKPYDGWTVEDGALIVPCSPGGPDTRVAWVNLP